MTKFQQPTLVQLILIGFVLVALPLLIAIVTAIVQVGGFARDNRQALVSIQQNASTSRALADRTIELERTARQYQALSDPVYKDLYREHRTAVHAMFDRLMAPNSDLKLQMHLTRAKELEIAANRAVKKIVTGVATPNLENTFVALRDEVVSVVQAHNGIARELGNSMPTKAAVLQRLLLSQAALVIPLSAGLAVVFSLLIVRPVRQIDQSIRLLGRGALSESIQVSGTRDLEELGLRLDWLRIRLLELEAQKAQFLRNVSHELKTPLTNIREGAELLVDEQIGSFSEAEKASITSILRDNSVRLQKMIEELLHYGADGDLTSKQLQETVHFDQLVNEVLEQSKLALAARSIVLQTTLSSAIVEGNRKRLQIIINNLVSNAVKYTPCGGKIRIELNSSLDLVSLDVLDSGPGIHGRDAPHLFEWFYTGPPPPDAVIGATGMGLAIAQEYAQQHRGQLQLIECPLGAHFRLTLSRMHHDQT